MVVLLKEKEVDLSLLGCALTRDFFLDLPITSSAFPPKVTVRFTRRRISHILPPSPFPPIQNIKRRTKRHFLNEPSGNLLHLSVGSEMQQKQRRQQQQQ